MAQKNLNYHVMPRRGWLNDPNGLVYFKGNYHIFYQADENSMDGSVNKAWGHYATKDFQTYTRHATAVSPDSNTIRTAHIQEVQSSEMTYCMYFIPVM